MKKLFFVLGTILISANVYAGLGSFRDNTKATKEEVQEVRNSTGTTAISVAAVAASTKPVTSMDRQQSPGRTSRVAISDNGDGTIKVSSGTGFARATNSELDAMVYFDWAQNNSVSLTDNTLNYVYVNYNSGSPTVSASTTLSHNSNTFPVAVVFRYGNDAEITPAGEYIPDYFLHDWGRLASRGIERMSGAVISSSGPLTLQATAGVFYQGINAINTSPTNTVTTPITLYRTTASSWTWSTISEFPVTQYDNGNGTLGTLTNNTRFGVYWIYVCLEGEIYAVYGRGDYTSLPSAQASTPPTPPNYLSSFAVLAAQVVFQKNSTAFASITSAYTTVFPVSAAGVHNDLGGLQGGAAADYQHLTTAQVGNLTESYNNVSSSSPKWSEGYEANVSTHPDLYSKYNVLAATATDVYRRIYEINAATGAAVVDQTARDAAAAVALSTGIVTDNQAKWTESYNVTSASGPAWSGAVTAVAAVALSTSNVAKTNVTNTFTVPQTFNSSTTLNGLIVKGTASEFARIYGWVGSNNMLWLYGNNIKAFAFDNGNLNNHSFSICDSGGTGGSLITGSTWAPSNVNSPLTVNGGMTVKSTMTCEAINIGRDTQFGSMSGSSVTATIASHYMVQFPTCTAGDYEPAYAVSSFTITSIRANCRVAPADTNLVINVSSTTAMPASLGVLTIAAGQTVSNALAVSVYIPQDTPVIYTISTCDAAIDQAGSGVSIRNRVTRNSAE